MPSKIKRYEEAYVWIWLPGEAQPVVAGKLTVQGTTLVFNYGQSYLERVDRIAIYDRELPLRSGLIPLLDTLSMPGCIRDGSPDAWGRRVLINSKFGAKGKAVDDLQLDELTFLLESCSDRIGALDFQLSPTEYHPRSENNVPLEDLIRAAEFVEKGVPLPPELKMALLHGTSIGGARPKALIEDDRRKYIAKFSSTSDVYSVIKAEFVAMTLARATGLTAASVKLVRVSGRDVLLVERFDRTGRAGSWRRKCMVSALTLLELDEMMARYASYEDLAEIIRHRFRDSSSTLKELFGRMTFNVLVGNTDDHARNHAAFWDGEMLSLTPAYDVCPQARSGDVASQAMLISGGNHESRIASCLAAAPSFQLSRTEALAIVENQVTCIAEKWAGICKLADVAPVDRKLFASRQFLNPYAFEGIGGGAERILKTVAEFKAANE